MWPSGITMTLDFQGHIWKLHTQEWDSWLTWNERYVSQYEVEPTMWPWDMTLTFGFSRSNFENVVSQECEINRPVTYPQIIVTMTVYGAWIKTYYVFCPKTYSSFGNVSWSTASSWQATRSALICKTGLLTWIKRAVSRQHVRPTMWPWAMNFGLPRSNFEKAVPKEWDGHLTWNERDESLH